MSSSIFVFCLTMSSICWIRVNSGDRISASAHVSKEAPIEGADCCIVSSDISKDWPIGMEIGSAAFSCVRDVAGT